MLRSYSHVPLRPETAKRQDPESPDPMSLKPKATAEPKLDTSEQDLNTTKEPKPYSIY